jgi:hypothetical protein
MLLFAVIAGVSGVVVLYSYGIEIFVANYSGAIYEVESLSREAIWWLAVFAIALLLPFAGVVPTIARKTSAMIVIGLLGPIRIFGWSG